MREPMVVDHAAVAPFACQCGNTTGPLLDTFFENPSGRVYVCKRCAKSYARIFGFAPGKKLDELQDATVLLEQKDLEVAGLVKQIEELRIDAGSARRTINELGEQLQSARGTLQSARHIAASLEGGARSLMETVAPPAPVEVAA